MSSRMVGGRSAGTVSNEPSGLTPLKTRSEANSGMYLLTGSSSFHLPSS